MWILTAKDAELPLEYLNKPMKLQPSPLKMQPPRFHFAPTAKDAVFPVFHLAPLLQLQFPRPQLRVTTKDAIFYQASLPELPDTLDKLKMLQLRLLTTQYLLR
ncbi:hypothetical protein EDB89DRAFT_1908373 [Lactarius sanguifluus]|nr:hypothetical protein EDB89DRAFT_1908373 [Lactarius sanguifluus]